MGRQLQASEEGGLFSLELSSHGGSAFSRGSVAFEADGADSAGIDARKLSTFAAPATMFEFKLLEIVKKCKPACMGSAGLDYKAFATLLATMGYRVTVQAPTPQCHCKSNSRRCLEVLSHTYLLCSGVKDSPAEVEIVIEPKLREQFEIAHPTEGYRTLLQAVPAEFVGSKNKLKILVEAISTAMAEAFKAQERSLPPWRRTSAALSKWDLDFSSVNGRSPGTSPEVQHSWSEHGKTNEAQHKQQKVTRAPRFGFPENNPANPSRRASDRKPPNKDPFQKLTTENVLRGENPGPGAKPTVSLLARGLADMAVVQKGKRPLEGGSVAANIKRAPSWDLQGLPPITTVRRSGRVS